MRPTTYPIKSAEARLIRVPVDPPRGDAIQQFNALEIPIVTITDSSNRIGTGFGYTIGTGGSTILELLRAELLDWLIGLENYCTGFLWRLMRSCPYITEGLRRAAFSGGWLGT